MAISVTCLRCHSELATPGALLFGPPDETQRTAKIHLCGECYRRVLDLIALDGRGDYEMVLKEQR